MAANRADSTKTGTETGNAPSTGTQPAGSGGFQAWLPILLTFLLMPALAYAMTTFVLIPKIEKSLGSPEAQTPAPASESHGSDSHGAQGKEGSTTPGKSKNSVQLKEKILVNVAGTMGTRYLVASLTLIGSAPDLKAVIDENEAQIRDLAGTVLGSKTIADLEKPGAKNLIRTELITVFNGALGGNFIQEIYFTEFAVQ